MFIRFLSSIQDKPKEVRGHYAFWMAVVVTGLIATPWFFGLSDKLESDQTTDEPKPMFSSFFDRVTDRLSEVTNTIDESRDQIELPVEQIATSTSEVDVSFISNGSILTEPVLETPPVVREVRIATTSASTTE